MKSSKFVKFNILLAVLIGAFWACQHEFDVIRLPGEENAALQKAKEWFEVNAPEKEILLKSDFEYSGMLVIPEWEEFFCKNDRLYETVEVSLLSEKAFNYVTPESYDEYKRSKNSLVKESITRLVIRNNKETGGTDGFFMTIVPDLEYIESTKYTPFRKMTYLYRDPNFNGYVMYHDLDGYFVNGWKYTKGKVSHTITPSDPSEQEFNVQTKSSGCYAVYMVYLVSTCSTWITSGDYTGSECYSTIESEYQFSVCPSPSGGGGGGGGYGGQDNGPGGEHADAVLNKILAKSDLDDRGYIILARRFNELIKRCMHKTMYNYAASRGHEISYVTINELAKSSGTYDPSGQIISFQTNEDIYGSLAEEFIHFFQDMYYPDGIEYKPLVNIEFEAQMLIDIEGAAVGFGSSLVGSGVNNRELYRKWIYSLSSLKRPIERDDLLRKSAEWGNKNYWDFLQDFGDYKLPKKAINKELYPAALGFISMTGFTNC